MDTIDYKWGFNDIYGKFAYNIFQLKWAYIR